MSGGHGAKPMLEFRGQASVPRDAFPPTPPGPEGSNGNGLLRVQWVAGAWLNPFRTLQFRDFCTPIPSSASSPQEIQQLRPFGAKTFTVPSITYSEYCRFFFPVFEILVRVRTIAVSISRLEELTV
jgi:hypothetical protein